MHRGSHDVGLSCVLCFFMQSWNSFITCTRTRLSDARITRSHATQLPQRPSTRVLSPAHLGARSEVSVRLKRQAVFHGPVLFLAARPPDNAVHDLPAPDEPVQLPLARVQLRASGVSLTSSSSGGPDMMSGAQAVCTGGKNTQHTSLFLNFTLKTPVEHYFF
jgi:hypothetical protein